MINFSSFYETVCIKEHNNNNHCTSSKFNLVWKLSAREFSLEILRAKFMQEESKEMAINGLS